MTARVDAQAASGPTWTVTFDAKREPMFQATDGSGWVPLSKHDEDMDALAARLEAAETALMIACVREVGEEVGIDKAQSLFDEYLALAAGRGERG